MSFSNYMAQAVLDSLFREAGNFGALSTPLTIYVALSTTTVDETSGGNVTEPSGNGYARKLIATTDWSAATLADPSALVNSAAVTFAAATGAWGTCTDFALFTAVTAGTYLGGDALTTSKSPTDGDTPRFAIGDLTLTLD